MPYRWHLCFPSRVLNCGGMQRGVEARRALFSRLHGVLFFWNVLKTRRLPSDQLPTADLWSRVLVSIRLRRIHHNVAPALAVITMPA